jgi:phage recombination protein Bet
MTEIAERPNALMHKPAIDEVDERRLDLIRRKVSSGRNAVVPTNAELAAFLELAFKYDLDPFANEVWLAKSQGRDGGEGQLLIMVGRDGLRKIAQRNGLHVDADVVRKNDSFKVVRSRDRKRSVEHIYGGDDEARGEIVGAWCEVWDGTGQQRGFNYAPIKEYMPQNERKRQYSPWGSTVSVMIQTAAERNALRQSTPLGGLLTEADKAAIEGGLKDTPAELAAFIADLDAPEDVKDHLLESIRRLNAVSPQAWGMARAQMTLPGRSADELLAEANRAQEEAVRLEAAAGIVQGSVAEDDEPAPEEEVDAQPVADLSDGDEPDDEPPPTAEEVEAGEKAADGEPEDLFDLPPVDDAKS